MKRSKAESLRKWFPKLNSLEIDKLRRYIEAEERLARIDENQSLLSVAEHEISLPNHCDNHDKYASSCHACKKRKWYSEISKDWKRVIEDRLKELQDPMDDIGKVDGMDDE